MTGLVERARVALLRDPAAPPLGAADCEAISDGVLAQPIATLSSLAFLGAAAWLALRLPARGPGRPGTDRPAAAAYAGLVALVGVGSIAYHGPQGPGAQVLHDLPIAAVVATGAVVPAVRLLGGRPALAVGGVRAAQVAAASAALGLGAFALGRTGSPVCDPTSPLQAHAAWHVLMAAALAAWGGALWGTSRAGRR